MTSIGSPGVEMTCPVGVVDKIFPNGRLPDMKEIAVFGHQFVVSKGHILPKVARLVVKGSHSLLCPKATTYNKWINHRKDICGHRTPQFLVPSG